VSVTLDGRPKLLARPLADPALIALEPGLELSVERNVGEHDLVNEARCY
jgi:hypothetical protein